MNSTQLMDEKSRKRKKFRKKHLDNENLLTKKKLDQTHEDSKAYSLKKKRKQKVSEKRKDLFFQKSKNLKNVSKIILNTGHTANTDYSEISTDADIKNVTTHNSEEMSLKAKKGLKKSKKNINENNNYMGEKSSDNIISKNIKVKRKRLHSDVNISFTKNQKRKKDRPSDSNSFDNESKDSHKKKSVLQKTKTEISSDSDSNEDEVLRNELKSFSIFKNIQKLLKDNPSLVSSANYAEEELSETESIRNSNESEVEELSLECTDSGNSDESDKESEILPNDVLMSTFNKKKKMVPMEGFKRTPINKNEKVVAAASTTSSCGFDRTLKVSSANRDGKVTSQSVASNLKSKALEKLHGAKFRYLNEKLYTESGRDSFNYFQKNKDEYMDYHKGYSLQVSKWPLNPVDKIIISLQKMKNNITIADMGCGDAKIARTLSGCTIHSFDLVALNDFVTPCNISKVPLSNESVDVVIFCLSLMGTNLKEYLQEAYRIAKFGGLLKIAEVESRIPNLDQFIKSIQSLGFSIEKKDVEHKLFVFLEFKKMGKSKKGAKVQDITLKPCLYKKR